MGRIGIFVDAGYLFAQGSAAISGDVVRRTYLSLNEQAVVAQLIRSAQEQSGGTPLLRIYWYDAIGATGATMEQKKLASTNNVKVRMGTLNGSGQQKGVDSMIVIDMIELARNHAISDAVLISGDEDVRVGVQFAQNYGVRVHLIGIAGRDLKNNQALSLIHESDTHVEWDADVVNSFLSVRVRPEVATASEAQAGTVEVPVAVDAASNPDDKVRVFTDVTKSIFDSLVPNDLNSLQEHLRVQPSIPREFDGKLLGMNRDAIGRDLDQEEKFMVRKIFKGLIAGE